MAAKSKSGWLIWLLVPALAVAARFAWRYYAQRSQEAPPDYRVAAVSRGDLTQTVTANGQINPLRTVVIGSQVSGMITDLRVDFNSPVTNGQLIAQIDPSTYQRSVVQSEAEVANARATLELARVNARRATELRTNALISVSEFDTVNANLLQAEAVVKMREASLERARVDLERTTITAPIDGVVISRAVEIGQTVAASFNTPTLFSIAHDLRKMRIEAMVSEADVGGVQEGQPVTFTVDAYPGREFRGQVTQVRFAPLTNQNVVNYTAVIEVSNDDMKLRPGMTANVNIITAQKKEALRIANAALRFRPPENASIVGGTNALGRPAGASGESSGSNAAPAIVRGGPPGEGGGGGGGNREEWRRRMESMSPEERDRMRAEFRARGGGGGGGGGMGGGGGGFGGGSGRSSQEGPVTRTVYLVETNTVAGKPLVQLKPATIKTGISDGSLTEVVEGLKEGDAIAVGLNLPATSATAVRPGSSPFGGSPFGGGMRPR
jgi:HlyD family secretion protein